MKDKNKKQGGIRVMELIRCRNCGSTNLDGTDGDTAWCYACSSEIKDCRPIETLLVASVADVQEFVDKLNHELDNISDGCDNPYDDPSGTTIIKYLKKFVKENYHLKAP